MIKVIIIIAVAYIIYSNVSIDAQRLMNNHHDKIEKSVNSK